MTSPAPSFTDPSEALRYAQYHAAQVEEYGTYIAAGHILVGAAPAFSPGHPVPKSTAEAMGWHLDGTVVPAGTELPVSPVDRKAQLQARAEELERERAAIALELSVAEAADGPDYEAMTVVKLRDKLATRGLPQSGNKDELIARLQENDKGEEG